MAIHLTRRVLLAGGLTLCATSAYGRARRYDFVADASTVAFIFTTGGVAQSGTIPIDTADIRVDTADLTRSSASVAADVRKIRAGIVFINQAIKSPELLDADNHPVVQFVSTRIRLGAQRRISEGAQIDGQLTLRGVTRPITLDATLSRPAGTAPDDLSVLTIRLTGGLSRKAYGAVGYASLADDRVALDIQAEIKARD